MKTKHTPAMIDGITILDVAEIDRLRAQNAELVAVLARAVESAGFSLGGPTDWRAAEHGESAWVCNARAVIARATIAKATGE